jgi:hypothetical protein
VAGRLDLIDRVVVDQLGAVELATLTAFSIDVGSAKTLITTPL